MDMNVGTKRASLIMAVSVCCDCLLPIRSPGPGPMKATTPDHLVGQWVYLLAVSVTVATSILKSVLKAIYSSLFYSSFSEFTF
jgi:hypothetical protein